MITVHGAITLLSPMHTSAGFQGLRLSNDGRITSNDKEAGLAVLSTLTEPLTVHGRYFGHIPVFPSSAIIGALRRHASQRMRDAILSDNKKLSPNSFYAMMHGQAAASQLGSTATLEHYNAARENPFFGMFGGATLRNAAQYRVSDMAPIITATIEASRVPQRFADLAPSSSQGLEPHHLLSYRVTRKVDDFRRGRDLKAQEDLDIDSLDRDAKTESAAAYQIVPSGTSFYFKLQINDSASAEQKGLLLLALADWVQHNQIGARSHLGWGQFSAHRFRFIDGDNRLDLFNYQEDEEGIYTLDTTADFAKLVNPAVKLLDKYSKSPEAARQQLLAILQ